MNDETLELLMRRAYAAADRVSFLFQGGEPTLAGLEFFCRQLELEKKYTKDQIMEFYLNNIDKKLYITCKML